MQNLIKKLFMFASLMGVALMTAGCCTKTVKRTAPVETTVFYQTYEDADVSRVHAKMYTRSSHGGESRMGNIKFYETDAGLKMEVDLKDLRPGVDYTVRIYQCGSCNNNSMCCDKSSMAVNLPKLSAGASGRLEESFIIRGLTAAQLRNAKIYLERDGGYKAAWGTLEKNMMF